jgi:hypothetical protein
MEFFFQKSIGVCVIVMEQSKVRELIKSNDAFVLILREVFGPDCLIGISYRFKSRLITMNSRVILPWGNDQIANPDNPAYTPYYCVPYTQHMSFSQRNINRGFKVILRLGYYMFAELPCEKLSKNYFVKNIPPLSELKKKTSLILVNCHFSLNNPRHTVPGFFKVAGLHIQIRRKLPEVSLMCYCVSGLCPPSSFSKITRPEIGSLSVLKLNAMKACSVRYVAQKGARGCAGFQYDTAVKCHILPAHSIYVIDWRQSGIRELS